MKKVIVSLLCMFVLVAMFAGCKKDKTETVADEDKDVQTSQDGSLAEGTFNDVNNIASQAVESGTLTTYRLRKDAASLLSSCATLDIHDTAGHGAIYVNFGSTPCLCVDGRYRKGIINIAYTGHYRDSGSVITITFDNYYVGKTQTDLYKVMGTKSVVNNGHNASGNLVYNINVNGSLMNTSGQTMTWNSPRQREWTAGEGTTTWLDDQYMISGSASGTGFNGTSFNLMITQPLHIDFSCHWIKEGKFDFTPGTRATRHFNYGNGACDNIATVTINSVTYTINLP
jgi:hypothetical protein